MADRCPTYCTEYMRLSQPRLYTHKKKKKNTLQAYYSDYYQMYQNCTWDMKRGSRHAGSLLPSATVCLCVFDRKTKRLEQAQDPARL